MHVWQICSQILDTRFAGITKILGVWDFKTFLEDIRPRSASKGIQSKYSLQFKVAEDGGKIMVRHKGAVDVRVAFGPWKVMLPDPRRPDAIPHRDTVPPVAEGRDWPEFEALIVPTLRLFYNDAFEHPVHIPDADKEEMLAFLDRGPDPPAPPEWIVWGDGGSDSDGDSDGDGDAAEFPFPVGTWVAFEFDDGTYPGIIQKVWHADLCRVDFADGDKADYDADEITYAEQLYRRDFAESDS